jgi:hypothetical protein
MTQTATDRSLGELKQDVREAVASGRSPAEVKEAIRAAAERGRRLSPDEMKSENVAAPPSALRPRDITIADRDPDDVPIVISV